MPVYLYVIVPILWIRQSLNYCKASGAGGIVTVPDSRTPPRIVRMIRFNKLKHPKEITSEEIVALKYLANELNTQNQAFC
ncbi:MAG: hypothetical protein WD625_08470 [Balneolales bacterium]